MTSQKPFSQTQAHVQEIARRRAVLQTEAEQRGLKQLPSLYSRVWVEPSARAGQVPSRFFVESYLGKGEPELVEYELHYPIGNLRELTEALKTLDAFYFGAEDTVSYARHGTAGLIEFLEDLQAEAEDGDEEVALPTK
jgi:hypothetical protein